MKKYIDQFQSLEKGKKIKVVMVAVLAIIIIYMALGMLGGSDDSYTPAAKNNKLPAAPVKTVTKQLSADVVAKAKIEKPQVVENKLNKKQKAYIKSVDQLQMLQLQQQIMQTKQQIAAAELQTAQTKNRLYSVTGQPRPNTAEQRATQNGKPAQPMIFANNYGVQYIANTGGKWQIIISFNGQLINGTLGTTLPDGATITKVTGNSVTLSMAGQTRVLSIQPAM